MPPARRLRRLPRGLPRSDTCRGPFVLRAGIPFRVVWRPGAGAAAFRRADLRRARARLRALQHALARDLPPVPAGRPGRGGRQLARLAHLAGAASPARRGGGRAPEGGAYPGEGRDRDAQLHRRADAVWQGVSGGRRGAYRAADGGKRSQSRGRGRARARARDGGVLQVGRRGPAAGVLHDLSTARVARRALLMVDDLDAAPLPRARRLPAPAAALRAGIRRQLARFGDEPGGELRGPAVRLVAGVGRRTRKSGSRCSRASARSAASGVVECAVRGEARRLARVGIEHRIDVPWVLSAVPRDAHLAGFDLHANVAVPASGRARPELLCPYLLRPAVAQDRLRPLVDGRVVLTLKSP